jgi:hypothetical protein
MALLALVASGAAGTHVAAAREANPSLALVDRAPVTVRGTGFAPRQRVVLRASTGGETARQALRTGARGGFVLRLQALRFDPCTGLTLHAFGAAGTELARLKISLRECPAPAFDP